jgi:hypothetical protein
VDAVEQIAVPGEDADWYEVWEFALTYNAYERHRGSSGAAAIGNGAAARWRERGVLPRQLPIARAALFFEQRRYHHFGHVPDGEDARYVRALLRHIRKLSGGSIAGPADDAP